MRKKFYCYTAEKTIKKKLNKNKRIFEISAAIFALFIFLIFFGYRFASTQNPNFLIMVISFLLFISYGIIVLIKLIV